jgi:hypothetical protein
MKNKLLVLGLIALMLAGGLALVSCPNTNCSGDGKCDYNSGADCGSGEERGCIHKQLDEKGKSPSVPYTCNCN